MALIEKFHRKPGRRPGLIITITIIAMAVFLFFMIKLN